MTLYSVAGLNTQIELPVPLIVWLIPTSQTNQRPGIKRRTPGAWVQHETANYNVGAGAKMHAQYLHNGAEGNTLSYHFTVDDGVIYQMIPVDEVTWQAADAAGPGNMAGVSCELCVNRGIDMARARANAEALAGGIIKALGMPSKPTRHYDYNQDDPDRHYCPKEMMTSGYWPTFVENVERIATGTTSTEPTPFPIPWKRGDLGPRKLGTQPAVAYLVELTAIKDINTYVAADPKSQRGPRVKMKDKVVSLGAVQGERNVWEIVDTGDGKPWRVPRHAFTPKQLPKP